MSASLDGASATPFAAGEGLPLFVEPTAPALGREPEAAADWIKAHRPALDALLLDAGALVLRGFAVPDTAAFARMIETYPSAEMDYTAGATPRGAVADRIYEATQTPPQNCAPGLKSASLLRIRLEMT